MNSLELIRHLHQAGYLDKTASIRVLRKRDELIKRAMEDLTHQYFFEKDAFIFGWGGKKAKDAAEAAAKATPRGGILGSQSLRNIGPLLGLAGLVALGTTAAKVGLGTLSDVKTKGELKNSYRNMFKEYPDLKEDRGQATKYFAMMSKYAPDLATNPIVAGTWIKQMMNMNVVDPKSISQLIDAQRSWEDVRSMKSPLIGFTQEMPQAKDIFNRAVMMGSD